MQDEEIRQVQYDMSFKQNVAPTWDCGISDFTVIPNTVKTQTDLWIRLMETTQQMNFSLLEDIPGTVEVTS